MNLKKLLVLLAAAVLLVSLSVTAFAAGDSEETTPAAAQDWKAARLEQLKALVADSTITQEQVDAMLARVTECMASCDGTGNQGVCNGTGRSNGRRGGNGCGSQGQCGRACGNGRQGGVGCGRRA